MPLARVLAPGLPLAFLGAAIGDTIPDLSPCSWLSAAWRCAPHMRRFSGWASPVAHGLGQSLVRGLGCCLARSWGARTVSPHLGHCASGAATFRVRDAGLVSDDALRMLSAGCDFVCCFSVSSARTRSNEVSVAPLAQIDPGRRSPSVLLDASLLCPSLETT